MSVSVSAVLVKFMLSRFLAVENVIEVVAQGLGSSGLRAKITLSMTACGSQKIFGEQLLTR